MGHFTSVSLTKEFNKEWPKIEYALDEGEDPIDALTRIKAMLESWFKATNKEEERWETVTDRPDHLKTQVTFGASTQPIEINLQTERIEIAIDNATSVEELKKVKEKFPMMNVRLLKQYNKKMYDIEIADVLPGTGEMMDGDY